VQHPSWVGLAIAKLHQTAMVLNNKLMAANRIADLELISAA
jgi:hypothetical protein